MPADFSLNLHLIPAQFALVMLLTGAAIELFAFLWRASSVRTAARWMILLGTVAAVPAAAAGFFTVAQLHQSQLGSHALITAAAIGLLLLACLIYIGGSDRLRRTLHLPLLIVVLISVAALFIGSFTAPIVAPPASSATTQPIAAAGMNPLGIHLILAAILLPLFVIALGLSFRAASQPPPVVLNLHPAQSVYAAALSPSSTLDTDFDRPPVKSERIPTVRFWIFSAICALAAAGAGVWMLATLGNLWHFKPLYHAVVQLDAHHRPEPTRRLAHVAAAIACILIPLFLALAASFSPRRGFIAAGFGILMVLSFSAAAWTGALLSLDSPKGSLTHFNRHDPPSVHHAPIQLEIAQPATTPADQQ